MSWDIFIFNSNQRIKNIEDLEENCLVTIGTWQEFRKLITCQFPKASFDDNWCAIEEDGFSLETSLGPPNEKMSNTIFHLYGADSLYALMAFCQQNKWQACDSATGNTLNTDKPEENGYQEFVAYLTQIKKNS
jgi:hypothetical protein